MVGVWAMRVVAVWGMGMMPVRCVSMHRIVSSATIVAVRTKRGACRKLSTCDGRTEQIPRGDWSALLRRSAAGHMYHRIPMRSMRCAHAPAPPSSQSPSTAQMHVLVHIEPGDRSGADGGGGEKLKHASVEDPALSRESKATPA
eukprot:7034807-Prymnesium_polylepis.2